MKQKAELEFRPLNMKEFLAVLTAKNVSECNVAIQEGKCVGVIVESEDSALHSISQILELTGVEILHVRYPLKDLRGLERFTNLKELRLAQPLGSIVSRQFKRLELLSLPGPKKFNGEILEIEGDSLRTFYLQGLSARSSDTEGVLLGASIERLHLVKGTSVDLTELHGGKNLLELYIGFFPKLTGFIGACSWSNVEQLEVENCKRIVDWSSLVGLKQLKSIKLSHCSAIESLDFLNDLPLLETFAFVGTRILSGDLTPLTTHPTLRSARFVDNKAFNLSLLEVSQRIASRA